VSKLLNTTGRQIPAPTTANVITIYARPHSPRHRSYAQQKITFAPKHSVTHYKAYPYFGVHCSPSRDRLYPSRPASQQPYTEWLLRARRSALFADTTGLKPTKRTIKKILSQQLRIRKCCAVDHLSTWISNTGALFFLNEPYCQLLKNQNDLLAQGFVYIGIPLNLSPYCGGGSLNATAPGTRSYLITELANQQELLQIEKLLQHAALTAPRWNDTAGVSNV